MTESPVMLLRYKPYRPKYVILRDNDMRPVCRLIWHVGSRLTTTSRLGDMSATCRRLFQLSPEILALNQVDISAPSWYEALYSLMIVAVGRLGPLPRSDKSLQVA